MAIFLITAPSGAGKTSIMNYIKKQSKYVELGECISHTTRPIRKEDAEVDGVTYYYIDREKFNSMQLNGEFAERVIYGGNFYGISKEEIERVQNKYKHVYVIVEFDGYMQMKEIFPEAVGIFLHASKEDCRINMNNRGDLEENVNLRLSTYEYEMSNRYDYNYVVKNVRGKQWLTARIIESIIMQYQD